MEQRQRALQPSEWESINELHSIEEQRVSGIMLVVGQKEEVPKKGTSFPMRKKRNSIPCCVISCTTPAALHPERFFNLRKALTPEEALPLCPCTAEHGMTHAPSWLLSGR